MRLILQITICDDQIQELNEVTALLAEYVRLHPKAALELRSFQSGHILLEYIRAQGSFPIYSLDVMMPDLDGLALGVVIRENDPDAMIIYFTSSSNCAVDSFSVQAPGYPLKPIGCATLFTQLDRVLSRLSWEQEVLTMKTGDRVSLIRPSDIRYAEGASHTTIFYLSRERTVTTTKCGSFHEAVTPLLSDERFLRVGASFLVSMLYADSIEQGCSLMQENGKILIPRLKRSEVRDRLLNFSLRGRLNL